MIIDGTNGLTFPNNTTQVGGPKVLQVLNVIKTDTFTSTTANTWLDITGLSISITPISSTNKILVIYTVAAASVYGTNGTALQVTRNGTAIGVGTTATGNQYNAGIALSSPDSNWANTNTQSILDAPATTSAVTYTVQGRLATGGGGTLLINRTAGDSNNGYIGRFASTITVMEIAE